MRSAARSCQRLSGWIAAPPGSCRAYDEALPSEPALELPSVRADPRSAWHLYVIRLRLDRLRVGRGEVFRALRAEIRVNVHYIPCPGIRTTSSWIHEGIVAGRRGAYERLVSLPCGPDDPPADVDDTIAAVRKVWGAYAL